MKAFAVAILCVLAAGCATPGPSPALSAAPSPMSAVVSAPPSPTPGAAIEFICPAVPMNGLDSADGCPAAYAAIETAVAPLGLPVDSITVLPDDFPCRLPFTSSAARCPALPDVPPPPSLNGVYVTFVGTDKVAALTITRASNGPMVAQLVDFEVPPAGWAVP
jgi:hypothetical protein